MVRMTRPHRTVSRASCTATRASRAPSVPISGRSDRRPHGRHPTPEQCYPIYLKSYLLVPPEQKVEIAQLYTFKGNPKSCEGQEKGKFEFVKVDYERVNLTEKMIQEAHAQDEQNETTYSG